MSLKKNALATVALTGIAVAVSSAYAAGFQLTEQSSLGLGRAFAGAGIVGDDLSAAHYNAAGMTLLPGTQIQAGSVYVEVDAPFKGVNGESENGRLKGQAIPAGYITHQLNDQTWVGLSMTVPYGLGTEWSQFWDGSDHGNQSMLMTVDINPNIAYKVSDKLSVGAGVSLQYAKAELGAAAMGMVDTVVNGDSWAWGFNLGLMYQPTETLRFGLAYRSQIAHDAAGDIKISFKEGSPVANMLGAAGITGLYGDDFNVRVTTPDTIMATATWEATPDLRLSGLIRWARWSNLDQLNISSQKIFELGSMTQALTGKTPSATKVNYYNWEDTWLFTLGADYRLNNEWTVRGGVAYETSAVDDPKTRTATIPDADRVWLSLGATYNYSKQIQFDFGATYLMGVGNMELWNEAGTRKVGEFDGLDAFILGAQFQYRF